jgi:2-dehydro-3-deoxygalactonokinase
VRRGAAGDLAGALFGVRAASVLGLRDDADAGAYASGLLIGSDVAVHAGSGATVYLLAEGALGELYSGAIEALGGKACIADSNAAFVAGISRLAEQVL